MLAPVIKKNDKQASWLIYIASFVVFATVVILGRVKVEVDLGFDVHILSLINAICNSITAILLLAALWAVKSKKYLLHKQFMFGALILSVIFLLTYIAYHLFTDEAKFGGTGTIRYVYYFILISHIILAAVILPFILFTAYRGLTAEFGAHKKLAKYTWPLWLYVAITGPVVYWMISPYY
jgi:putative membrane protein